MIKNELLIKLGWSEELINEVTRISDSIKKNQPQIQQIEPLSNSNTISTTFMYYSSDQSDTTDQVGINEQE